MPSNKYNHTAYSGNFLTSFICKILNEYKSLIENARDTKPLKIIEITQLSSIPGETEFLIQISNKNSIFNIKAGQMLSHGFHLNNFNSFHAEMIRQAAQGTLDDFLNHPQKKQHSYHIVSKKMDREMQQFQFTVQYLDDLQFTRTADELYKSKHILKEMDANDTYDIGFTHGCESIIKENNKIISIKQKQ